MNYRHAFHAGNHLDVFKHAALIFVLEHLLQKSQPFACGTTSCKSICVTCVIPVCLDFLLSSP